MKATVIGGGIIGLSSALYLQQDGWEVTVLDKGTLADNCSFGNMGYLSPSHFATLAQPGVINQGILWMFQKKSPFYVRPELSPQLIDWGLKFYRACNANHVQRSAKPMLDLLLLSKELTRSWIQTGILSFEYAEKGCINYFQTKKYEKSELENVYVGRDLGLQIDVLSKEEIHELEPDLKAEVRGAAWYKDDAHLQPNELMNQLIALLKKRGVNIITEAEVTGFQRADSTITAVQYKLTSQPEILKSETDMVVLAAGSWSSDLARLAGEKIPLMPGKGYSMTIQPAKQLLHHPCILVEAKVAMTPWQQQLRIGSTMEIGSINDKILFPRVQGILEAVGRYFPAYKQERAFQELSDEKNLKTKLREKVWYGFRPLSADGLPYIGFGKKSSNLILATRHGMLGISMGAGTGTLVAELAAG